jgi:hypothetical protein
LWVHVLLVWSAFSQVSGFILFASTGFRLPDNGSLFLNVLFGFLNYGNVGGFFLSYFLIGFYRKKGKSIVWLQRYLPLNYMLVSGSFAVSIYFHFLRNAESIMKWAFIAAFCAVFAAIHVYGYFYLQSKRKELGEV